MYKVYMHLFCTGPDTPTHVHCMIHMHYCCALNVRSLKYIYYSEILDLYFMLRSDSVSRRSFDTHQLTAEAALVVSVVYWL